MRELDLLLEEFLENRYQSLPPVARESFVRLLDCENEDLRGWLLEGKSPQDEQLAGIVSQILDSTMPGT
jgi:antitoxin CptB